MNEETRRAIAYSAAAQIRGKSSSSVYSYAAGGYTSFSGDKTGSGYDYSARAHISASNGGLYHYGQRSHISLKISGKSFSGYDYGSGSHFSGSLSGSSVQIYDYGQSQYFTYNA